MKSRYHQRHLFVHFSSSEQYHFEYMFYRYEDRSMVTDSPTNTMPSNVLANSGKKHAKSCMSSALQSELQMI